jgi:hypothetical protein
MSATESRTDQPTVAVISSVINLTHSPVLTTRACSTLPFFTLAECLSALPIVYYTVRSMRVWSKTKCREEQHLHDVTRRY